MMMQMCLGLGLGFIPKLKSPPTTTLPCSRKKCVCKSMAAFNEECERERKRRLTFCVEGNIGVGKSTFLKTIGTNELLNDLVEIVPEDDCSEPWRWRNDFKSHNRVFVEGVMKRVMAEPPLNKSNTEPKPLRLMERSAFTDMMVFMPALHEAEYMTDIENGMCGTWFEPFVGHFPELTPDAMIYLRASPETCHERIKLKGRSIPELDHLRDLHQRHETWLLPSSNKPAHVDNFSVHPDIRAHDLHGALLVIDWEPNIDFNTDIQAKRRYARQVAEFFEFVKKKNEADMLMRKKEKEARMQQIQSASPEKSA